VIFVLALSLAGNALAKEPEKIIHDAEYEILLKQNGDAWAVEDKDLEKKLNALKKKHGKRPNQFISCGTI